MIGQTATYGKFEVQSLPENFLGGTDTFAKLNDIMGELEGSYRLQTDVDAAYGKLCEIVKGEMLEKLNYKTIKIFNGLSNKRRRVGKPIVAME